MRSMKNKQTGLSIIVWLVVLVIVGRRTVYGIHLAHAELGVRGW